MPVENRRRSLWPIAFFLVVAAAVAVDLYGPLKGHKQMRGFGVKYARMHTRPKELRMAFVNVKNASDWRGVLDKYYPAHHPSLTD